MPKFQIVSMKNLSGLSRERKVPYNMLVCGGVFTNDDGTCELGEITFMEGTGRPLPVLQVGQSYTPVIGAQSRQGKLEFRINELKPIAPAATVKAA